MSVEHMLKQHLMVQESLVTKASIPTDGSGGKFGYGIITGTGTVIVTTTQKEPR